MARGAATCRRRPRAGVVALILLLLLAACGAGTGAPASQDPGATATAEPAPSATDDHEPAASLEPIPVTELDEELVASLVAEGYTETEAAFLALTNVDAHRIGDASYEIVAAFPTGNLATMGIELAFDQVGDPEELTVSTEETAEGLRIHLEYLVPYDVIPADAVEQLRSGTTAGEPDRRIALAGLVWSGPGRHVVAKEASGIGVIVDAVIGEARDDAIGAFVDFLQERMNVTGLDALLEGIKSLLGILDAMKMSTDLEQLKARIDALEDCARNPTDPLTKRRYAQDPNALQQILDAIERVRADVKANTAVMYVGLLNKTGSGLVKVPGLNYVVGAGTAWSEETLKALNESYIEELRQMITPCEGYQFEFDGKAFGTTRLGDPARIDFHYWGVLCPNEEEWRIWEETDGEGLDSYITQRPENTAPMLATFNADGQLANILLMGRASPATWYGTTFVLDTPDAPATITATIPLGDGEFEISERIVPADDSIFDCP